MNTQRLTISLPDYLYQALLKNTQPRKISQFVASVLEEKILTIKASTNPVEDFLSLRKKLPKKETNEILRAIKKGRM